MPTALEYGIIYNWDGAPHGYSEVPQSMEAFLDKAYAPLEDIQVGALFWCIGEHAARWPSDVLELLGDVHGRHYESASAYIHTENIRQMLERGEDPQEALIERGHQLDRPCDRRCHRAHPWPQVPLLASLVAGWSLDHLHGR